MNLQALREARKKAAEKMHALFPKDDQGNLIFDGGWSDENQSSYDALMKEVDDIDRQIKAAEKYLKVVASDVKSEEQAKKTAAAGNAGGKSVDELTARNQKEMELYTKWMRGGNNALNADDWEVYRDMSRRLDVRGDLVVGTDNKGGHLAPDVFHAQLMDKLKAFGGMRANCSVQSVGDGRKQLWPTTDSSSEEGEIIAETSSVALNTGASVDTNITFGIRSLEFDMYSSKIVLISRQLLQDSQVDLVAHLVPRISTRIARTQNKFFTIGSSTAAHKVKGIADDAPEGASGATGQVATVKPADLLNLIHSIDPAYRVMSPKFMFHDNTLLKLKQMSIGRAATDLAPLWLPSIRESEPDTIYGYPYFINQHTPVMAASAKSIYFGDFTKYQILDAIGLQVYRFEDEYIFAKNQQVGFLAIMRSAARLMDVGGAVKHYANPAT